MSWRRMVVLMVLLGSCRAGPGTDPLSEGQAYVDDAAYRRDVLERSLVNPANGYSTLRLAQYQEHGWGALPEWNPPVAPVAPGELSGPSQALQPLDIESVPWETTALVELGHRAFSRYPVQFVEALRVGLAAPEQYGLWRTGDRVGGVVWVQVPSSPPALAMTCATCHASVASDGQLIEGRPNGQLDLGGMLSHGFGSPWGRGRVDVTDDGLDNPAAIPDLRPVRSERYLHHDATVRNGLIELAIRLETLIITSHGGSIRPPRKLTFAIALYLWQLEPKAMRAPDESSARGAQLFAEQCAGCHAPPDYSGDRVALDVIGTDPALGNSPERTTGTYRVPSLRGVGDRAPLFSAGQLSSLDELLDPSRSMAGHRFGLDLTAEERADLLAFLQTLQ